MKKTIILTLAFLLIATPTFAKARDMSFRLLRADGTRMECTEVIISGGVQSCYTLANGNLTYSGFGTLEQWTGLYDTTGLKIYEGDLVNTPGLPTATVTFGDTDLKHTGFYGYYGWYLKAVDASVYTFRDLTGLAKNVWSTITK